MCHKNKPAFFPQLKDRTLAEFDGLKYWSYESESSNTDKTVIVLTDIYGCNSFYQGFASYWVDSGWNVILVDLFVDLWELKEITREAAFERRHNLKDSQVCDKIKALAETKNNPAIIGFCLGGNYVLELARRNASARLVAFYPFPAGLPNQDQIAPAFEYMEQLTQPVTVITGALDDSAGRENITKFKKKAERIDALNVQLYMNSGHGFLTNLDSDDDIAREEAIDALAVCEDVIAV